MNILENIKSAISGIVGNKMRASLTMFGIIIGISSVMMITSVGEGFRSTITGEFESMGLDRLTFQTNNAEGITIYSHDMLMYSDVELIRQYDEVISAGGGLNIFVSSAVQTLDPNFMRSLSMNGVDAEYLQIDEPDLIYGRIFAPQDIYYQNPVVIIDEDFAIQTFGRANVIGETLYIDSLNLSMSLQIIGVTASTMQTQMMMMFEMAAQVHVPLSITQNIRGMDGHVSRIVVRATDVDRLSEIGANIIRIIEHNRDNVGEDKYRFSAVADGLDEANMVINLFTAFLSIVAGISLLVGGIGVMNIMLVSVTERTREIGIRKSLGATDFNIRFQFLVEAMILTAIGGILGIGLGYVGGLGIAFVIELAMQQSITPAIGIPTIALVVGFSALVGIVFGVYPASKAAKLDPIEALRFE
ncbi:MAG: ABC transporter permease [Defluviitaleaceae bacterium]|nr:ABC transporter permease [Defluviitaleaceae bacterium]